MNMPLWIQAGWWGGVAGAALLIGAAVGYGVDLKQRFIAAIMSFGAGVLISALTFDLMNDAYERGGFTATSLGFVGGSFVYTLANIALARHGAKHRKRSGHAQKQPSDEGSGIAIAVGALLDGIPESIAIGISLIHGGAVSVVTVLAIFISNVPEGLSSSAGMKRAGRSKRYVFGIWAAIAVASGLASLLGYSVFRTFPTGIIAATIAVAAGAILTMLVDTMIPEAFEEAHDLAGLITVLGFVVAFALSRLGG
jgi:ZIP family zinc transporter